LPQERNQYFTGRARVLELLRKSLTGGSDAGRVQAIYGAPGVGKTQLALEYAYRHLDEYGLIWWMSAGEPTTLAVQYGKLAERMGASARGATTSKSVAAVRRELARRKGWLLIFDNAPDADAIRDYLPEPTGHVLITSRSPKWHGAAQSFCLRVLERADSLSYLLNRTGLSFERSADMLAQALGDLPLALEQAAATIDQARISFSEYLRRFEDHWAELLASGRASGEYPDTVAMTWELACREVEEGNSQIAALLKVLAYLAPTPIGRSMLRRICSSLPAPLSNTLGDAAGLEAAIETLRKFSLLQADERSAFVHQLVAALTRDRLPVDQQRNWCEVSLTTMLAAFPYEADVTTSWADSGEALPHALAVCAHAEAANINPPSNAKLMNLVGDYLTQAGQYLQARDVLERALAISDKHYGPDDPRRSAIINNLGRVLKRLGDVRQARAHFEAALVLDQAAYGETHPHVAEVVNNYGTILHVTGDVETARKQFEWALEICRSAYGPEHAKVATVTNNLGYSLANAGDLDRALDHFTQALATAEASCGPDHPLVASIRTNLGIALRLKGQTDRALAELQRAAAIGESALGPDHPELARNLAHLGSLHQHRGEHGTARQYFQRALEIDEKSLGLDHLLIIARLNDLGRCLKAMGEVDASATCYTRAAEILRKNREGTGASAPQDANEEPQTALS
jgi:tetratricopeptide (TPR) repeat protein